MFNICIARAQFSILVYFTISSEDRRDGSILPPEQPDARWQLRTEADGDRCRLLGGGGGGSSPLGNIHTNRLSSLLPVFSHVTGPHLLSSQTGPDLVSIPSHCNVDIINIYWQYLFTAVIHTIPRGTPRPSRPNKKKYKYQWIFILLLIFTKVTNSWWLQ